MKNLESRIDTLVRRDRLLAVAFAVVMWAVLVFVCVTAVAAAPSAGIAVALVLAMAALGGLNTASMFALIRRYRLAKYQVYQPDIENLALQRAEAARRRSAA
ncbi:hypothetical protein H7X46_20175 [Pseudonocardia sp. C8]|uniref:hypothetical protein n=1 Tax=Pseudonocardia sp. C8 TaxID=2762759 RepID=UPI001642E801|nr:hypothetical protein [Pseudonocardia sp. C8]MBC3193382.1 hypothetical protein [Pseudonocardia sp. C8]